MLHDMDSSKLNGDSPDLPSVPAMDLMDSYTHVNNVHAGEDAMGGPSWNDQQPTVRQAGLGQSSGEFGVLPSSFVGGQGMHGPPLLGQTGVNPSSLEKDPVMAPLMPTQESGIQRGHNGRPEQDSASEYIWKQRVAKVYRDKTAPFRYTEGYHILLKYATQKYDKADVLRIVRALAIYRPSLIALQMPLSEEDEIFVERAFQRTILEFEKLISLSGTPTVVWRRTCEISLVGTEFCMLTQWSKEDLLGQYIYQFMDKESVLNYWEMFANHVFENTSQSVMTKCVLMTPSGKPIPCTWCFTIKRDPFELPGFVVGNVRVDMPANLSVSTHHVVFCTKVAKGLWIHKWPLFANPISITWCRSSGLSTWESRAQLRACSECRCELDRYVNNWGRPSRLQRHEAGSVRPGVSIRTCRRT